MKMSIYLKKLELKEPIEIFNLLQEGANGDWESIDSMTPEEFPKYTRLSTPRRKSSVFKK